MKSAKKVAFTALFSALCTVILCAGALIETLDASLSVAASLLVTMVLIEAKASSALAVWGVSGVLSLLLFPLNSASWLFLLFFGWYPVLKQRVEKIHFALAWSVKLSAFNVAAFAYWWIFANLLKLPFEETGLWLLVLWLMGNLAFVLYDLLLTRAVTVYIFHWRSRLGFKN